MIIYHNGCMRLEPDKELEKELRAQARARCWFAVIILLGAASLAVLRLIGVL